MGGHSVVSLAGVCKQASALRPAISTGRNLQRGHLHPWVESQCPEPWHQRGLGRFRLAARLEAVV